MLIWIMIIALIVFDRKEVILMDFSEFQWKNRLLLLFAPDSNHPLFKSIHAEIMAQRAEVEDRDLVVFEVLERGPSRMNSSQLDTETVDEIRKRFAVPRNQFTLILVGKDGGTKLKRNDQTDLKDIFGLIDSMPMRQNEIQRKDQR